MNAVLGNEAAAALAHPLDGPGLAITGPARSGKTHLLLARAFESASRWSGGARTIVSVSSVHGLAHFEEKLRGLPGLDVVALEDVAFAILDSRAARSGTAAPGRLDTARAAALFEPIGASLFALDWDEFLTSEIDPEITGLRAPERFAAAAFRLICKLRGGAISPDDFKRANLQGANKFYAHPQNLAASELIAATPQKYRDSLRASPQELLRQREREIDLGKILARLYETYVQRLVERGCMTGTDAMLEAMAALRTDPLAREEATARWRGALIDEAQDLTGAHLDFVAELFGAQRRGVTVAGGDSAASRTFAGARGEAAFKGFPSTILLPPSTRMPDAIAAAVSVALGRPAPRVEAGTALEFYRGTDKRDEAAWVATTAAALVANGVEPARIAVIARDLGCASVYLDLLLARGVCVDLGGHADLFALPFACDVLAMLWALADPYRHDWLLRVLEGPAAGLSDASLAALCGDPASAQALLFEMPDEEPIDDVRGRWDRRRDLRLGGNVTHGDIDPDLPEGARERVIALRTRLLRYARLERELALPELVETIACEVALEAARRAPSAARERFESGVAARLVEAAAAYARRSPLGTLHDFLSETERASDFDADLRSIEYRDSSAVALLDVEAAKGRAFSHVFVVDVRAGAFPQYYVPDAFIFTPGYGTTAKENVGDADAARTAKFSYLWFRMKLRDKFVTQERRAFAVAASRATERLYVSASGRRTKGMSAPEIAAELENFFDSSRMV